MVLGGLGLTAAYLRSEIAYYVSIVDCVDEIKSRLNMQGYHELAEAFPYCCPEFESVHETLCTVIGEMDIPGVQHVLGINTRGKKPKEQTQTILACVWDKKYFEDTFGSASTSVKARVAVSSGIGASSFLLASAGKQRMYPDEFVSAICRRLGLPQNRLDGPYQ